jgi:hypothetical protein
MWIYKPDRPPAGTFDRIFEISDLILSNTGNTENNTIALDISSSGIVFPVLTSSNTSCFTPLIPSNPILNYNVCNGIWNNIVWQITSTRSILYINGSNTQIDTISTPVPITSRKSAFIANSFNLTNNRDFSGNLDDFRYYKDKALNYAEIYQLYNNNFYTLDICGGFLANGSSVIYEPSGSKASANSGSLTLLHGDASGSSSIMFKSLNDPLEYGYIQYEENAVGSTGFHYGLMTIGIENDAGTAAYTAQADRVSLFPSGGTGFVGINTKTPFYSLDISGILNTNADASINGVNIGRGAGNVATNTAIGYQALSKNTTGIQNVAVGYQSLFNSTTSTSYNTAVGYNALGSITTGTYNVAIGVNAGGSNAQATSNNTFLGGNTSMSATSCANSTAVGYGAVIDISNQIKLGTTSEFVEIPGEKLIIKGGNAKIILKGTNTAGSFVLCNGMSNILSQNNFGIALESAAIDGTYALPFQINTSGVIGIGYTNSFNITGYLLCVNGNVNANSYNASSDYRIKKNVMSLDLTFNVDVLKPVSYVLKDDKDAKLQIGFIAHEVQEFYPFLVNGVKDGPNTQSINYNGFIGILTKEIQVLKKKVAEQEARIVEQEAKALEQDQRIQALEKMMLDLINK